MTNQNPGQDQEENLRPLTEWLKECKETKQEMEKETEETEENTSQLTIGDITLVSKNKTILQLKEDLKEILKDKQIKSYLNFKSKQDLLKNISSKYSNEGGDDEDDPDLPSFINEKIKIPDYIN